MPELIEACLEYFKDNLNEIVEKSENMPNLKSHIAKKLAWKIPIDILDKLNDPRDLLVSWLYKKKLELFFEDPMNLLHRCIVCDELFTSR